MLDAAVSSSSRSRVECQGSAASVPGTADAATLARLPWHSTSNDGKFLVALKHFLCPHSQLFRASRSHLQDVLCDDLVRTPSTAAAAAAAAVAGSLITSPASNMRRCACVPATGRAGGR